MNEATMPTNVAQLIDSCPRFSWQEALALVQSIVAASLSAGGEGGVSSGTCGEFLITESGTVMAFDRRHAALSISEVALLLTRLPSEGSDKASRTPAGVHLAIARALGLVEAPPFSTLKQFSDALARFEHADRAGLLRVVFERCTAAMHPSAEGVAMEERQAIAEAGSAPGSRRAGNHESMGAAGAGPAGVRPKPDRRRSGPSSDVLRRLLREEDRINYGLSVTSRYQHRHTAPPPDVLRRLIREADERTYELAHRQSGIARLFKNWRRTAVRASLGLAMVTAGGALAGREYRSIMTMPAPLVVRPATGTPFFSNPLRAQIALPAISASSDAPEAPTIGRGRPRASGPQQNRAPIRKVRARVLKEHTAKRPVTVGPVTMGPAATATPTQAPSMQAPPADRALSQASQEPARRGPVPRFFAAIYRGLGRLVHRGTSADAPDAAHSSEPSARVR